MTVEQFPQNIDTALAAPLDGDNIVKREGRGGKTFDYIESHVAIQEANEVFGRGGWSYEVKSLQRVWEGERQTKKGPVSACAYTAVVSVRVGDAVREDVGYGDGMGQDHGEATELAAKEAVSDAMKRCLRTFGDRFGLVLYEKDRGKAHGEGRIAARKSSSAAKQDGDDAKLRDLLNAAGAVSIAELDRVWEDEVVPQLRWLPKSWFVPFRDHYEKAREELEAKQ